MFSTLHSYFYCCLSFSLQGGHQALKNKLVKNRPFSYSKAGSRELKTRLRLRRLGSSHAAKKERNSGTTTKQYHRSRYSIRGWVKFGT